MNKKTCTLIGTLMLTMLLGACASTPNPQERRSQENPPSPDLSYAPGQTFIYDNGRVETYVGARGDGLIWRTLDGNRFTRAPAFFVPVSAWATSRSQGARSLQGADEALRLLTGGDAIRFTVVEEVDLALQKKDLRGVQHWRCSAGETRPVTVPLGNFQAVPITCAQYSAYSMRPLRERIWDYVPDLGHYVRVETRSHLSGRASAYALTATVAPEEASRTRIAALARETRQ